MKIKHDESCACTDCRMTRIESKAAQMSEQVAELAREMMPGPAAQKGGRR